MAVILSLLTILLALVLLISLPPVQTRIIQVATSYLNKDSDFTVKIGYINISWFDAVYLKDLSVTDPLDSTMISTQRLHVDVSIIDLIRSNRFRLDAVNLENTKIQLIKPDSTSGLNINTWIAELNERFGSEEPVDTTAAAVFGIGRIRLKNGVFAMYDLTQAPLEDGFDYQNFQLDNVNLSLQNFHSEGDSLAFNVLQLEAYDDVSGLEVNRLETAFRMNAQLMHFDELDLSLNESRIGESIRLNYDSIDDLSDFIDKVQIQAILTHTYLDTRDLALFAPALADYTDIYKISGEFDGTISDFKINNLAALLGENSLLKGTLSMQGLPDINATFIQASLNNSVLDMRDLQTYLPIDAYQTARKFGMVNLTSEFIGYTNDFVANGRFRTALGNIRTDINLKLPQNQDNISYNGSLYLRNFQLGKLLDQEETIQQISFDGLVKGQGIDPEKAVIELDAKIAKLGVLGYDYQDIIAEGKLAQGLFEGSLDINDPNLKFTALGNVNLAADQELINISASLDTAFFQELNLTDQELFFSSKMVLNTTGFDIDNLTGEAYFTDNYLYLNGRGLEIQNFDFASTQTNRNRKITLSSELLNGEISGDFLFTQFVKDLKQLLEDYRRILVSEAQVPADSLNSSSASKTSNKQTSINSKNLGTKANEPKDSLSNYTITYNFDLTDVSPLVHLLEPSFYASKNINLSGEFINGENTIFNIFTEFDSLFFKNNWFFDNTLDFNTAKVRNTSNILAMGFVESKKQKISNSIDTDNLFVEALWDDDHIDFSIGIEQLASDNKLLFEGELDIMTDRTEITFKPSEIRVLERKWEFTPNNLITISDGEFGFFDFKISNQNQAISLEGFLSSDPEKEFIFKLDQFEADNINPVTLQSYEGLITSKIIISDPFNDLKVSGDLQTEEFRINSLLVGDITASAKWNNNEDEMDVSLVNNRRNIKTVDINGSIAFNNETQNFDLTARFDEAVLNVAEPFLQDYISNIRGTASGSFRILGTFDFPNITGNGEVKGAQMKVNYLGTTYNFDGGLVFTDNEIGFRRLALKDNENNTAFISGGVFHDGFSNFVLDISGNLNKFKLLNTTARDNELFYGTAVATGNISVLGAANNLTINAKAKTETGTRIFIPIGGTSEQKTEDFIKIVNKLDTSRTVTFTEEVEKLDITGLKMNFDLEITPDAYTEIIIDPRTGDIIRGRGNGDIKLEIDSKGTFKMTGDYTVTEAFYNFTLGGGIITKEFIIEPGGKISWFGDPMAGTLNLRAYYEELASLASYDTTLTRDPQLSRRYPVKVNLNLDGPLLEPNIQFGFDFSGFPETSTEMQTAIASFKNRIQNDDQEMNRQVFSVIILRRFSPQGSLNLGGGGGASVGQSLSQLLSNQLSYLVAQIDQNLEIDFDLSGLDENALNTFQLRLSYTLLNGRLRITRDGGVANMDNTVDATSIAGDWTAEYLLTEDGKYRVKIYNRNNFNTVNRSLNNRVNTTGVSLLQTITFNSFNEFFNDLKKKKKEENELFNDNDEYLRNEDQEGLVEEKSEDTGE